MCAFHFSPISPSTHLTKTICICFLTQRAGWGVLGQYTGTLLPMQCWDWLCPDFGWLLRYLHVVSFIACFFLLTSPLFVLLSWKCGVEFQCSVVLACVRCKFTPGLGSEIDPLDPVRRVIGTCFMHVEVCKKISWTGRKRWASCNLNNSGYLLCRICSQFSSENSFLLLIFVVLVA